MRKEKKDKHFVGKATYPGGIKAMQEFLRANKKYPEEALKLKIEGTVHLRYTIDYKGKVIKTTVIAGLGHGCDEEAERVVKLLIFNVPRTRKLKVQYHKTIHIHFRLPKEMPKQAQKFIYDVVGAKKEGDNKPQRNYNYKVEW